MPDQHNSNQFEDSVINFKPSNLGSQTSFTLSIMRHESIAPDINVAAAFAIALSSSSDVEAIRLSWSKDHIPHWFECFLYVSKLFDHFHIFPPGTVWELDPLGIHHDMSLSDSRDGATAQPASICMSWRQLGKLHPFQNLWSIAPCNLACTEAFNIIQ